VELRDTLPKSFRGYFESIDNAGPEFTTYMRMYQHDDVVPITTLTGLLCSYLVLERNCTAVTYVLHNLSVEEVDRAGGKEGTFWLNPDKFKESTSLTRGLGVKKIYAAFKQIVGGFELYRGALDEIQWKGFEGATSEKCVPTRPIPNAA